MAYSVDETTQRAEQLERKTHDAISEFRLEEAVGHLREALAIREAYQGEAHPDLIWILSLWIYALGRKHQPESALEVARLGERRLALRRTTGNLHRLGSEPSYRLSASDLLSYPWAEPLRIFEGG
jgi:hypothetical protein